MRSVIVLTKTMVSANHLKLITVNELKNGNTFQPRLMFTDDWLTQHDFVHETIISAIYEDDVLTLQAHGVGLNVYQNIVSDIRQKRGQIFQALNVKYLGGRRKETLYLNIQSEFLTRIGFSIGSLLLVESSRGWMTFKKIAPTIFNFLPNDEIRILKVARKSEQGQVLPRMMLAASWIADAGFSIDSQATATYEADGSICLMPAKKYLKKPRGQKKPNVVNISSISLVGGKVPYITLTGIWLLELGFNVDDILLVGVRKGHIRLKPVSKELLASCR